jgi:hypothetical protein
LAKRKSGHDPELERLMHREVVCCAWQARQKEKEAAVQRVQHLEADNADLSGRLVEMKMTEMERINNVDQICSEMIRNAQSMERAAAAESSGRQVLGKFFGKPSGVRQGLNKVQALLLKFDHLEAPHFTCREVGLAVRQDTLNSAREEATL